MELGFYITTFALALFVFIMAVVFHELGHIIYIRVFLRKQVVYGFTDGSIYITFQGFRSIDPKHKIAISLFGIFSGIAPIILFTSGNLSLFFVCLYLIGAIHDLVKIFKNIKVVLYGTQPND